MKFKSTISKMGRKRIINVPAKLKIKIGTKVKVELEEKNL